MTAGIITPSSGRLSKLGVASCSSHLATRPLRSRKRRSSTNASLDSIWRAKALEEAARDAAGSEARKSRNPSEGTTHTSESERVNTLAVRALSARMPSPSPTNAGVWTVAWRMRLPVTETDAISTRTRQQEEDLIGWVPLVAEIGSFAVVAKPPLIAEHTSGLRREGRPARGWPPSLPRSLHVGSST